MKWLIPKILLGVGIGLFGFSLLFGVFTVGVPTPNATPAVAAQEVRDGDVAGVLIDAGCAAFVFGLIWIAVIVIVRGIRRHGLPLTPDS